MENFTENTEENRNFVKTRNLFFEIFLNYVMNKRCSLLFNALTARLAFTLDRVKGGRVLLRLWEPGRFVFVGWPFGEGWRGSPRKVAAMSLIDWPSLEVMTAVQE